MSSTFKIEKINEKDYYERAVIMQARKIKNQAEQLARLNSIYNRDARTTTISSALGFLFKIIKNKLIIKHLKK